MLELFRSVFAPPRDLILPLLAGWIGIWLAGKWARVQTPESANLDSLAMWSAAAFVAGGRLLFAGAHLQAFTQSPWSLVSPNASLFDTWAGVISAGLAGAIFVQRKHLRGLLVLDVLAPFLAALSIGLGLAHLASGAAFGRETQVPWAIDLWGAHRHPTQLYEIVAALLIVVIIWRWTDTSRPGFSFLLWAALTAAARLLIEGFRGDSTLVFGGMRLAQLFAWVVLAAALIGMELLPRAEPDDAPPTEPVPAKKKRTAPSRDRAQSKP